MTCAAALRVEILPSSGSKTLIASAKPAFGLPAHASFHSAASSAFAADHVLKRSSHSSCQAAPRSMHGSRQCS